MAELKIEVFTGPRCPHCPQAVKATKKLVRENQQLAGRLKWVEVSTGTRKGMKRAEKYGIRGVPTIVITNRIGEKGALTGTPSQKKYLKYVYEMLGENPPEEEDVEEEKKGILDRILKR